jgi:hypothetical protein
VLLRGVRVWLHLRSYQPALVEFERERIRERVLAGLARPERKESDLEDLGEPSGGSC